MFPLALLNDFDGRIPFTIDWTGRTDWLNCTFSTATGLTDSSANNQSFTNIGSPSVSTTRYAAGALDLNGSQALHTPLSIGFGTAPFAISVDAFVEVGSSFYSTILAQRVDSSESTFELYSLDDARLYPVFYFSDASGVAAEYSGITRGVWHTIQIERKSDGRFIIGLDGYKVAEATSTGNMVSRKLNIGSANDYNISGGVTGSIKNLRIAT